MILAARVASAISASVIQPAHHGQDGRLADRFKSTSSRVLAWQYAARHDPSAHRHVVERKGERAESSVKDTEQGTSPSKTSCLLVCLRCLRHTVMPISRLIWACPFCPCAFSAASSLGTPRNARRGQADTIIVLFSYVVVRIVPVHQQPVFGEAERSGYPKCGCPGGGVSAGLCEEEAGAEP
jgi:hypothetical protein